MVGLAGGRAVPFVIAEEDVLEARLVACQRHDRIVRRGPDHSISGSLHRQAYTIAMIQGLVLDDTIHILEGLSGNRTGEGDRDLIAFYRLDLGHVPDAHQAPITDDADGCACLLHFTEDV